MSSEKTTSLIPEGFSPEAPPEGFKASEMTITKAERLEAFGTVGQLAELAFQLRGATATIKDLMLGIEASLFVMTRYTNASQTLKIFDHIRERLVSFSAVLDAARDKAEAAEAAESDVAEAAASTKH